MIWPGYRTDYRVLKKIHRAIEVVHEPIKTSAITKMLKALFHPIIWCPSSWGSSFHSVFNGVQVGVGYWAPEPWHYFSSHRHRRSPQVPHCPWVQKYRYHFKTLEQILICLGEPAQGQKHQPAWQGTIVCISAESSPSSFTLVLGNPVCTWPGLTQQGTTAGATRSLCHVVMAFSREMHSREYNTLI